MKSNLIAVITLVDGYMKDGKHSIRFDGEDITSGVYFYTIKTDDFTSTRKMMLMK